MRHAYHMPWDWLQALQGAGNTEAWNDVFQLRIILKQSFQPEILLSFKLASFMSFMVYNTIIFLHRPLQNIFYLPKQCKQKKKKKRGREGKEKRIREGKERKRREKK